VNPAVVPVRCVTLPRTAAAHTPGVNFRCPCRGSPLDPHWCRLGGRRAAVTSLTLDNCDGGCAGADLTIDVTDNLDGTYTVLYTIDTTDYVGPRDYLVQVGFKVIQGYTDVDLVSAPNGLANWSEALTAPVSSDGTPCSGGGDNTDKVCIYAKSNPLSAKVDAVYGSVLVVGGSIMDTSSGTSAASGAIP
jgi:hypothetical protein